jgi:dipeptidyl aminopeptidase/acylaminoacyl peptidase
VTAFAVNYIRDTWVAIDPATGRDLARLEHELDASIAVASQSDDDALWVVGATRPDRPPAWHLLDRRTGKIAYLFSSRPNLEKAKLAPMHGAVITARDGLELVSYLTLPASESGTRPARPMPTVLLVHGGPWARDGWYYHRDVQWLKRIAIYGASYGGYAAFVGATFTPDVFCCSVPVVGVTNLETLLANPPPYWASFYETECHRVGDPRTPEGVALLRSRSPLHRAGTIKKSMLIGHGANDVRCKVVESDQIVAAMTEKRIPVIYVVFPDEGHGFARPENALAFRAIMESFLARHLGGHAEPIGDDFKGSSHQIRTGSGILKEIGVD